MSHFDIIRQPKEKVTGQILVCHCSCLCDQSVTQKLESSNFSWICRGLWGEFTVVTMFN